MVLVAALSAGCGGDAGDPPADCEIDGVAGVLDECGVCGGDGSSCADCSGDPDGLATIDACGICGGDGTSCADCAGVPNGSAQLDGCGVCEGDDGFCECREAQVTAFAAQGNSCGFVGEPGAPELPGMALDERSYSELFSGEGYEMPFPGASKPKACGACIEVSGPLGSVVGVVQEVADIATYGELGQPEHILVESSAFAMVSDALDPVSLPFRLVACPISDNIQIRREAWTTPLTLGFSIYNHRVPVAAVEIQPADWGAHPWVPLVHSIYNQWVLIDNLSDPRPLAIDSGDAIRLRIISIYGDIVVTDAIPLLVADQDPVAGYFDAGGQLAEPKMTAECPYSEPTG